MIVLIVRARPAGPVNITRYVRYAPRYYVQTQPRLPRRRRRRRRPGRKKYIVIIRIAGEYIIIIIINARRVSALLHDDE